jgi:hypothetical protein
LANNPDVAHAKVDPALHYTLYGGFEGRDPGPDFHGDGYLNTYVDLRDRGINPLLHYLKFGLKEGRVIPVRKPTPVEPRFRCSVCQNKIDAFLPLNDYLNQNWEKYGFPFSPDDFETLNSRQYSCPYCGAADRDRLSALYLSKVLQSHDLSEKVITILDIAPSPSLKNFLLQSPRIKYQSADRYMMDVDLIVDITDMHSIPSETYDLFICSHVLEHVSDDRKALSELFRILKVGGHGILMVPVNLKVDKVEEDPELEDIAERWRRFGQGDHIRLYSKEGFLERVGEAGFSIDSYGSDFFGKDEFLQYGISLGSMLYIVKKN